MSSPFSQLRGKADPNYVSQVESVLNDVRVMTGDEDLAFLDMNEPIKSWARYCRRDTLSKVAQIDMVGALMKLVWWCALPIAECDYPELILIVRRALLFVVGQPARIRPALNNAKRQHLIVCGPLSSTLHSPTLGAIDYARALSDSDPGCEITFLMCQYFLGADVQPYIDHVFANQKNKPTIKDLNSQSTVVDILESSDVIISHIFGANALDPRISQLARIYPTIMFTCGDMPPFQYADVYWHQQPDDYVRPLWRRCGVPEMYIAHYSGGAPCTSDLAEPIFGRLEKADAGFSEDQVIMVTVGNRLAVDITVEFLEGMFQLLMNDPKLVWMIVGAYDAAIVDTIVQTFGRQVVHIPYEPQLLTLLTLSDIFVNPFRKGGGGSAFSAMRAGSIVLTRTDFGDVAALTPQANGADSAEDFFERLRDLIASPSLRSEFLARQNVRVSELTDQSALSRTIAGYVELAQQRFESRQSQGIDFLADA